MGIYFKPSTEQCHALSSKDSSQYWQLAADAAGWRTEPPAGEALMIKPVRPERREFASRCNFLPELAPPGLPFPC